MLMSLVNMGSDRSEKNLELAKIWLKRWNEAVDEMVDKSYAPDCVVEDRIGGNVLNGREELRGIEHQMIQAAPQRRMEPIRYITAGDIVVVECLCIGLTPKPVQSVAILTFNEEGLITSDHSYGPPPSGE